MKTVANAAKTAVVAAQIAAALLAAVFTHKLSVRLGNGELTAKLVNGGSPVKLTPVMIATAAGLAYAGLPAFIQSGDVQLIYTPFTVKA
jgi:hypothetical protein